MPNFDSLAKDLAEDVSKVYSNGTAQDVSNLLKPEQSLGEVSKRVNIHLETLLKLQNDLVKVFRSNNNIEDENHEIKNLRIVEKVDNQYTLVETQHDKKLQTVFGEEIDELRKIQAAFQKLDEDLNKNPSKSAKALDEFRSNLGQEKSQEKSFSQKVKELFAKIFSWKNIAKEEDKQNAITSIKRSLTELDSSTQSLNAKVQELKPLLDPVIAEKYNAKIQDPVEYNKDWVQRKIDEATKPRNPKNKGRG